MVYYESNYLCHYGIKGMKWGQRRWQNSDGTFNAAGKARYFGANSDHHLDSVKEAKQKYKAARKEYNKAFNNAYNHNHPYSFSKKRRAESDARWEEAGKKAEALNKAKSEYKQAKKSVSGSGAIGNARFRPSDKSQQSKNWQINRMGGRKINASYETRRKRGEALTKAGRSDLGAIGRHVGRNLVYGLGAGLAISALGSAQVYGAGQGKYGIVAGAGVAGNILKGAAGLYTVSSIIKTYQDISDMHTYKDSKDGRK